MVVLPCLVFVLAVVALPKRDLLGLIGDDGRASPPTRAVLHRSTESSPSQTPTSTVAMAHEQPTLTPSPRTSYAPAPAPTTVPPTSAESNAGDHSSKTWQIVGISIIAVLFVATSIACAMFFDRLWTFLKDVICRKHRPVLFEELITDCKSRDAKTLSISISEAKAPEHTVRPRELPWDTDRHWNTLHRQPSRGSDHL